MGGNALKNTETYRAEPKKFLNVYNQVIHKLSYQYPDLVHYLPRQHRAKPDHGDIDILLRSDTVPNFGSEDVERIFNPNEIHSNGGVYSFDLYQFQVDLVKKSPEHWECSKVFFDQSGLGNLQGKIARHLRFKWGFQGLRYMAFYDRESRSVKLGEFVISRNPKQVFEFLGFDFERFQEGFVYQEELFDYVIESDYFSLDAFMPENLTADQRHRDTKRKSFHRFMNYLENNAPDVRRERNTHEEAIEMAENFFPDFGLRKRIQKAREKYERKQRAKNVLNGNVLMNEFGLEGKELGKAIGKFKSQFDTDEEYYEYLLEVGREKALGDFSKTNDL